MFDLKRFREENKITQKFIAELFNCGQSNIVGIEKKMALTDPQMALLVNKFGNDLVEKYEFTDISLIKNRQIPYYDIDFMAGTAEIFNDGKEAPSHYIDIKPFDDCNFALPIFGDSMYPIYQNGDIVLCKEVVDKSIIPLGEAFLIVTKEHRMLKYLRKGPSPDTLLAVSENSSQYDPFPIKIDSMDRIYIVKGVIKRKTI